MIRDATLTDVPTIIELGRQMHNESIFAPYDFNEDKVAELVTALISIERGIVLVSETDGTIAGGFMGAVHPHWFGNDLQASDYALFLAPETRNGRTGLHLIKAYVAAALDRGAKQVMLANSTGYQSDRVAKLFESFGFRKVGGVFEMSDA